MLRRNLLIYGLGGIVAPFPGIWVIDQLLDVAAPGVRRPMWSELLDGASHHARPDGPDRTCLPGRW